VGKITPRLKEVEEWLKVKIRKQGNDQVKNMIAIEQGIPVNYDHYLRRAVLQAELNATIEVDHTFECQLINYCIMQTKELRSILNQVNTDVSRKNKFQPSTVRDLINPIFYVHNGSNQGKAGLFNLRNMEKNLNLMKGKAFTDFLDRQKCTLPGSKGGPIDFVRYFNGSDVVKKYEIATAEEIAKGVERDVKRVIDPYISHLMNSRLFNSTVSAHDHEVRMEALCETIKQVFDKMF
jgi:hypothetical protein